jgi:hypothetical protein
VDGDAVNFEEVFNDVVLVQLTVDPGEVLIDLLENKLVLATLVGLAPHELHQHFVLLGQVVQQIFDESIFNHSFLKFVFPNSIENESACWLFAEHRLAEEDVGFFDSLDRAFESEQRPKHQVEYFLALTLAINESLQLLPGEPYFIPRGSFPHRPQFLILSWQVEQ